MRYLLAALAGAAATLAALATLGTAAGRGAERYEHTVS